MQLKHDCCFIAGIRRKLAYLQVPTDRFFSFGLGAGQLLPQHLLPHVDGLQRLLDVEEVLLQETQITSKVHC